MALLFPDVYPLVQSVNLAGQGSLKGAQHTALKSLRGKKTDSKAPLVTKVEKAQKGVRAWASRRDISLPEDTTLPTWHRNGDELGQMMGLWMQLQVARIYAAPVLPPTPPPVSYLPGQQGQALLGHCTTSPSGILHQFLRTKLTSF